ncbi:hypothetical protein V1505DRAFT_67586 [Lipomyces doorenjongii]
MTRHNLGRLCQLPDKTKIGSRELSVLANATYATIKSVVKQARSAVFPFTTKAYWSSQIISIMESVYAQLTDRAIAIRDQLCRTCATPTRVLIAIAGPPGSGKCTITREVVTRLNEIAGKPVPTVVPMDGFHLTQATLRA